MPSRCIFFFFIVSCFFSFIYTHTRMCVNFFFPPSITIKWSENDMKKKKPQLPSTNTENVETRSRGVRWKTKIIRLLCTAWKIVRLPMKQSSYTYSVSYGNCKTSVRTSFSKKKNPIEENGNRKIETTRRRPPSTKARIFHNRSNFRRYPRMFPPPGRVSPGHRVRPTVSRFRIDNNTKLPYARVLR